jgi:hypothetical protein
MPQDQHVAISNSPLEVFQQQADLVTILGFQLNNELNADAPTLPVLEPPTFFAQYPKRSRHPCHLGFSNRVVENEASARFGLLLTMK